MIRRYCMILLVACIFGLFPFCVYANSGELSESAKAALFNKTIDMPVWVEKTVSLGHSTVEDAKKFAESGARFDARRILRERIIQTEGLNLTRDIFDVPTEVIDEDTTGKYGKSFFDEGTGVTKITFRFKVQCEKSRNINPFEKKGPYNRPAIIKEFKETDAYWEIVAVGYGFYESFEGIDSKNRISGERGIDSACGLIINKVKELGITDQVAQENIAKSIKAKKNYGGTYRVWGCGVEVEAHVPIRINKKDASVSYIYN
ncbi:hypothetical protein SRRS_54060 [Sporomusa rhizae]|uniref:hypothetical protein n=1 Tax=Sporomusa rhizae TaxID=357999 RepID=UPI00352A635B